MAGFVVKKCVSLKSAALSDPSQEELKLDMDMIEKLNEEFAAEQQQMSDDKIRLKKELDT